MYSKIEDEDGSDDAVSVASIVSKRDSFPNVNELVYLFMKQILKLRWLDQAIMIYKKYSIIIVSLEKSAAILCVNRLVFYVSFFRTTIRTEFVCLPPTLRPHSEPSAQPHSLHSPTCPRLPLYPLQIISTHPRDPGTSIFIQYRLIFKLWKWF